MQGDCSKIGVQENRIIYNELSIPAPNESAVPFLHTTAITNDIGTKSCEPEKHKSSPQQGVQSYFTRPPVNAEQSVKYTNEETQCYSSFLSKLYQLRCPDSRTDCQYSSFEVMCFITSIVCFVILCILLVNVDSTQAGLSVQHSPRMIVPQNTHSNLIVPKVTYNQELEDTYSPVQKEISWNRLPELVGSRPKLKFVIGNHEGWNENESLSIVAWNMNTYKVIGHPKICSEGFGMEESIGINFPSTTHLEISEIGSCRKYTKLILDSWTFPNIRQIKLHRMAIYKEEFLSLVNFIDRHNETISKVEIDGSYVCPNPDCDAGLINYPDHDFHILIMRRQESPEWVS